MLRIPLLLLIAAMAACPSVAADPVVRVINFTAGWCPLCRVLDPRLQDAVASFESRGIALIELDMTHLTPIDDPAHRALDRSLQTRAMEHGVGHLWDWYGGHAGIAVIVAADNGEPLTCIRSALTRNTSPPRAQTPRWH
jgi:thiol-disulfide isomerase/thioredoxin